MFDFIADLDNYFCEKYANYDKLCVLPGYRMPKMHASEVRADGRTYAYTLPASTMRLATQEKKDELLALLKTQITDKTFSFSFNPLGFFARRKNKNPKYGFVKWLEVVLGHYNLTTAEAFECLSIDKEIWNGICKGNYLPSKNLIFSLALGLHFTFEDMENLLSVCGYSLDYAVPKDVVVAYLVQNKVFNPQMRKSAFAEYKVGNLFLAEEA